MTTDTRSHRYSRNTEAIASRRATKKGQSPKERAMRETLSISVLRRSRKKTSPREALAQNHHKKAPGEPTTPQAGAEKMMVYNQAATWNLGSPIDRPGPAIEVGETNSRVKAAGTGKEVELRGTGSGSSKPAGGPDQACGKRSKPADVGGGKEVELGNRMSQRDSKGKGQITVF